MAEKEYTDAQNRKATDVPANEITKALDGLDFPADKNQLVNHAQQNNAPEPVLKAIRKLPEKNYNSPIQVTQEYGDMA